MLFSKSLPKLARHSLIAGCCFAMLSVALGAFAAHGLKAYLSDYALGIVNTAADYQMYHALGLLVIGLIAAILDKRAIKWAFYSMLSGIILFSGSLYLLAFTGSKFFAVFTPIGGALFILAWGLLILALVRHEQA